MRPIPAETAIPSHNRGVRQPASGVRFIRVPKKLFYALQTSCASLKLADESPRRLSTRTFEFRNLHPSWLQYSGATDNSAEQFESLVAFWDALVSKKLSMFRGGSLFELHHRRNGSVAAPAVHTDASPTRFQKDANGEWGLQPPASGLKRYVVSLALSGMPTPVMGRGLEYFNHCANSALLDAFEQNTGNFRADMPYGREQRSLTFGDWSRPAVQNIILVSLRANPIFAPAGWAVVFDDRVLHGTDGTFDGLPVSPDSMPCAQGLCGRHTLILKGKQALPAAHRGLPGRQSVQ